MLRTVYLLGGSTAANPLRNACGRITYDLANVRA